MPTVPRSVQWHPNGRGRPDPAIETLVKSDGLAKSQSVAGFPRDRVQRLGLARGLNPDQTGEGAQRPGLNPHDTRPAKNRRTVAVLEHFRD
jgi:hypothetical protein